jgi:ABC-2 type transport system permease protein
MTFLRGLSLLLKYRILMWNNIPKRRGRKSKTMLSFVLIFVIIGVSFGVPGYFLMRGLFFKYSQVTLGSLTLADLFLEISLLGVLMLVVLIDTPAVILSVFMSEDVQYLLTLPIPQTSIFYFKVLETLIEGTFPALFFIPVFLAYANVVQLSWYVIIFAFLLYVFYVLFCAGISGFISLVISKFVSKSGTKRFMFFSSTATLALAYLMINITTMPAFSSSNISQALGKYVSKVNFALWPSTWFLNGMKGNYLYSSLLVGSSLALFVTSFAMAKKSLLLGVSNVKSSTGMKKFSRIHKSYKVRKPFPALVLKEFKLLKREPSVLFMVLYPAFFPIIFILPNPSNHYTFMSGELMGVFMASTYLIISMASLVSIDVRAEWVLKSLPVERSTMLWAKALMITSVYITVLFSTFVGISLFLGGLWYAFLISGLSVPVFLTATFFGVYAVTKWPNPSGGTKKPLNVSGGLLSTAIGFMLAAMVSAESLYIYFKGKLSFLKFNFEVNTLLFLCLPISVEIAFIIFTVKKVKKIDWGDPFENGH